MGRVKRRLQNLRTRVSSALWVRLLRRPGAAKFYYPVGSSAFDREHRAVLAGIRHYREAADPHVGPYFTLRRNVHRIEKGMLMRPRREQFAAKYIEETVDAYASVAATAQQHEGAERLAGWADDVLRLYFEMVGPAASPAIESARRSFLETNGNTAVPTRVPYARGEASDPPVGYPALWELARRRRSVRWFAPKPVDRSVVDAAVEVALQAPSACNRQPFHFRIFDEPDSVRRIVGLPRGTPGYAHNIQTVVVVVGQLRAFFDERDRHLIYVDASLAAMSFMLALESLGASSCPINWPDVERLEQQMARLLQLAPDERVIMLIAVGKADPTGMIAYSEKRPLSEMRSWNPPVEPEAR